MRWALLAAGLLSLISAPAMARGLPSFDDLRWSGKLLLTGGVSNVEGAGGGGLATWATTTGYGARDGIGGDVHATLVALPDYQLRTYGAAVGLFDRLELSYTRQEFDTGSTGALLGLGSGFTFDQDVYGAKLVLAGDAVYDQDRLLPQIAIGAQYHHNDKGAVVHAVGGLKDQGTDYYIAATKLLLAQSLLLNATLRYTDANQFGILGFGGAGHSSQTTQFEGSAAWLASPRLAFGAEYRTKPNNLAFAKEDDAYDVFAAYAINKHLSVTAAYVDLGDIATIKNQRGAYISLQAGF
jgi:hypothetical protein